jgi:hypothetical protein
MLTVYKAEDQKDLDGFISRSMSLNNEPKHNRLRNSEDWMFVQPDCGKVNFPAQFVVVRDWKVRLATIQVLQ